MDTHRYILLLGTGTDQDGRLRQARDALKRHGQILARSGVVHGPSVVAGDATRYANQALLYVHALPRDEFADWLKALETALGRRPDQPECVIDIDLVGECDAGGSIAWQNDAKLEPPLFRELVAKVLRR